MRIKPIFILLLCIGHLAPGQDPVRKSGQVSSYQLVSSDSLVTLNSPNTITAIAIKSEDEGVFKLVQGERKQIIPKDPDVEDPTYFLSLEYPNTEIKLIVPAGTEFEVFLIASGEPPAFDTSRFRNSGINECNDPPPAVPQSTWREGLPEPNYTRSFHEVFHNVIHHSAGSNTNTNYTQVVRDIYLYHTEVNGWSDIGYNYLIAQDGTLYTGRDPGSGSQDNVRGAHFCGANSGTLGICLLGNYETATPTMSSRETLESLVTFQLLDQGHDPYNTYNHPLGNLGTIIGHRDGCATLCPGENVYNQLMAFKSSVETGMQDCMDPEMLTIETDTTLVKVAESVVYQALGDYDEFEWILPGALPRTWRGESVSATYAVPGTYDVTLIAKRGLMSDTLALAQFMKVSLMKTAPVVFPNPVVGQNKINIDFVDEIVTTALFDFHGRLVGQWDSESIFLNELQPGIYFLSIQTNTRIFKEKLVIL
jgi:hypothetical protein